MSLLAAAVLSCIPTLPFYCRNIHIGCAGRTKMKTEAFIFQDTKVTFEGGKTWQVLLHPDRGATILWRDGGKDWIRIERDGRFSLRRYPGDAVMTRGTCRQVPQTTH